MHSISSFTSQSGECTQGQAPATHMLTLVEITQVYSIPVSAHMCVDYQARLASCTVGFVKGQLLVCVCVLIFMYACAVVLATA